MTRQGRTVKLQKVVKPTEKTISHRNLKTANAGQRRGYFCIKLQAVRRFMHPQIRASGNSLHSTRQAICHTGQLPASYFWSFFYYLCIKNLLGSLEEKGSHFQWPGKAKQSTGKKIGMTWNHMGESVGLGRLNLFPRKQSTPKIAPGFKRAGPLQMLRQIFQWGQTTFGEKKKQQGSSFPWEGPRL